MTQGGSARTLGDEVLFLRDGQLVDALALSQRASVAARTKAVFGAGNANAELMFVGEAPGFHEDKSGVPFVCAKTTSSLT